VDGVGRHRRAAAAPPGAVPAADPRARRPTGPARDEAPTLLDRLDRHLRERPHAPAAADPSRRVDFAGLHEEVRAAAAGLARWRVGPGDRVAVALPNCLDFLVISLATTRRGATFVPLATSNPPARNASLVADADVSLVVTADGVDPREAGFGSRRSATVGELHRASSGREARAQTSDHAAYIIYTSGSTGTPKGVVISHHALAAALAATGDAVGLGPLSRGMCVSPFHFDGSFATLFGVLYAGGLATIPSRDSIVFPRAFVHWASAWEVDVTGFSPTFLRLLLPGRELGKLGDGALRTVALGGEALVATDILALMETLPRISVYNRFGPTETTIAVSHHRLEASELIPGLPVPIGRAHPGSRFHVLDERNVPVSNPSSIGELWIGGAQLMDGYWRADELTAAVLRSDVVPGEMVYRSGDLVRSDAEGVLTWLERADRVVKHHGVRVGLAEVSAALSGLPGVSAAATLAEGRPPETSLVGFVVPEAGASLSAGGLHDQLHALLPAEMVPDELHFVDRLPIASSGKLDEARLLAER